MTYEEALRVVFPLLDDRDLSSCMQVSKQWKDIAGDDYLWKRLCAKRWPSICKSSTPPSLSYRELFHLFSKRCLRCPLRRRKFSFDDLEFYIDIWDEDRLLFSEVIPGSVLPGRIKDLPHDVYETQRDYLSRPDYKMIIPIEARLSFFETVSLSILVCRRDTNQFACICEKFDFECVGFQDFAPNHLDFAPNIVSPDILDIRPCACLLCSEMNYNLEQPDHNLVVDVFGIALELGDAVRDESDFLSLLHMLDWD